MKQEDESDVASDPHFMLAVTHFSNPHQPPPHIFVDRLF
jgi:hypothetical protein